MFRRVQLDSFAYTIGTRDFQLSKAPIGRNKWGGFPHLAGLLIEFADTLTQTAGAAAIPGYDRPNYVGQIRLTLGDGTQVIQQSGHGARIRQAILNGGPEMVPLAANIAASGGGAVTADVWNMYIPFYLARQGGRAWDRCLPLSTFIPDGKLSITLIDPAVALGDAHFSLTACTVTVFAVLFYKDELHVGQLIEVSEVGGEPGASAGTTHELPAGDYISLIGTSAQFRADGGANQNLITGHNWKPPIDPLDLPNESSFRYRRAFLSQWLRDAEGTLTTPRTDQTTDDVVINRNATPYVAPMPGAWPSEWLLRQPDRFQVTETIGGAGFTVNAQSYICERVLNRSAQFYDKIARASGVRGTPYEVAKGVSQKNRHLIPVQIIPR